MTVDVANIRPLYAILGPEWRSEDVMWLFDPDVQACLLIEDVRAQRGALMTALNAVAHAMMARTRRWNRYRLGEMQHFYTTRQIANVGRGNRAQLDALFAEAEEPPTVMGAPTEPRVVAAGPVDTAGPVYHYPVVTFCGVAWGAPVEDYNANQSCRQCPHLAECSANVTQRNGYALCEIILPGDLIPEEVLYA